MQLIKYAKDKSFLLRELERKYKMIDVLILGMVITSLFFLLMVLYMIITMVLGDIPSRRNYVVTVSSGIVSGILTISTILIIIFPTLFLGDVIIKEQYNYNISAVEDNRDIEGKFRGSRYYTRGYIEQTLYYYIIQENNGYKTIRKIPANKTRIIESDNEQPKIVYYGEYFERTEKPVGKHFRFNKDYYELYVPSDTVADSWLIDLE